LLTWVKTHQAFNRSRNNHSGSMSVLNLSWRYLPVMSKTKQIPVFAPAILQAERESFRVKSAFHKRGAPNEYTIEMRTSRLQLRSRKRNAIL
jgi:hypothetical protein